MRFTSGVSVLHRRVTANGRAAALERKLSRAQKKWRTDGNGCNRVYDDLNDQDIEVIEVLASEVRSFVVEWLSGLLISLV